MESEDFLPEINHIGESRHHNGMLSSQILHLVPDVGLVRISMECLYVLFPICLCFLIYWFC